MAKKIDEYEYLEQMLSVYEYQRKKIEKIFESLESYKDDEKLKGTLVSAIALNILTILTCREVYLDSSLVENVGFESFVLALSYLFARFIDKELLEKKYEKYDLDQLAMELYDYQEREKGIKAQMKKIDEDFSTKEGKLFTKKL